MSALVGRRGFLFGSAAIGLALPRGVSAQTVSADQRVRDLKLELPRFPVAPGNNLPFVRSGNLVFLAGLGPRNPDGTYIPGRLGKDMGVQQAYPLARLAGLRALAALQDGVGLDNVTRIVKLLGLVNATPDFTELGPVIDGCSDLLVQVFGPDRGRHARTVLGIASLPFNMPVEIDLVVEVAG